MADSTADELRDKLRRQQAEYAAKRRAHLQAKAEASAKKAKAVVAKANALLAPPKYSPATKRAIVAAKAARWSDNAAKNLGFAIHMDIPLDNLRAVGLELPADAEQIVARLRQQRP